MSKSRKRILSAEAEGSMMGMSDEAVWSTGVRNELEKWKLLNEIGRLTSDEKLNYRTKQKELRQLKDDITLMIAEGFVYKTHCFGKYDPYKTPTERENFNLSNNTDSNISGNNAVSCPLPSIYKNKNDRVKKSKEDVLDSDREVLDLSTRNVRFHDKLMHMRPKAHSVQNHKPIHKKENSHPLRKSKSEIDCLRPEEKILATDVSTPRSEIYEYESDNEEEREEKSYNVASLASSLHGLVMWRQRARERHEAEQETERKAQQAKERNQKKFLPKSVPNTCSPEFKAMFPGNCKTYYAMKKFVHKEAERMINHSDSPMYEKKRQRLRKLIQQASMPQFIHRDRTTSAIFRDFKTYKSKGSMDTSPKNG